MSDKREMTIEYMALSEVRKFERNPKSHNLRLLNESMRRFGFVSPVIVNEENGKLLAGHGRCKELDEQKRTGMPAPDGIRERADGEWEVPVIRGVTMDETDHGAYIIADNRVSEVGGWENKELAQLLQDLDDTEDGLVGVGYSADDIADLLKVGGKGTDLEMTDDNSDDVPGMECQAFEHWDYVMFMFRDQRDWLRALEALGIQKVDSGFSPKARKIGLGRVLKGLTLLDILEKSGLAPNLADAGNQGQGE